MMTTPYEEGDPTSKICIFGEAPGRSEIRQQRPLVGPSGQLLESCMHAAGLVRREVYMINLFEEVVRKSKDYKTITTVEGDILWTTKSGLTELGRERSNNSFRRLENCSANIIVPLGGVALHSLYGDVRILKWRGSIISSLDHIGSRKLIPIIHPAAVLRGNYLWKYLIINDLARVKEEQGSKELNLTKRNMIVSPDYSTVLAYLSKCVGQTLCFDIEVRNHQVSCIALALSPYECISIPFCQEGSRDVWSKSQEEEIWLKIAELLGDPTTLKIGQNLIFDISFLLQQMNIHTYGPLGDTMIAHHILYPDFPKGLDFLCSMHTREPYYKDEGKIWKKRHVSRADIEEHWMYNCKDGATTFEVWNEIEPLLDEGYRKTYDETMELFPALLYMIMCGVKVDADKLKSTSIDVLTKIKEKEDDLLEAAEVPFNPTSPLQCNKYFYETKGLKPYISRSTGRPTTDDKALSRIYRRYNLPEAKLVQEIRTLKKLRGTYLEVGVDKDGRIRCSYNPRGTTTGRLSSSQTIFGTGMNMQNLHPDFKGFLVADD